MANRNDSSQLLSQPDRSDNAETVVYDLNYVKTSTIFLFYNKLAILLIFVPLTFIVVAAGASHGVILAFAMLALIPLAASLGDVTEQVALYTNPTLAGLLNATFGNFTEMVISIFAIRTGQLRVVQCSLLGSVISNLLLVLGCSFLAGGIKYKEQQMNQSAANTNSSLMFFAAIALCSVTVSKMAGDFVTAASELSLSRFISFLMLVSYVMYIYFQLHSHSHLFGDDDDNNDDAEEEQEQQSNLEQGGRQTGVELKVVRQERKTPAAASRQGRKASFDQLHMDLNGSVSLQSDELEDFGSSTQVSDIDLQDDNEYTSVTISSPSSSSAALEEPSESLDNLPSVHDDEDDDDDDEEEKILGLKGGIVWLGVIATLISLLSEMLVESIDGASKSWNVQEIFISTILLPIVGNAAEHASAVTVAYKNKIDLAIGVAMGSSVQISLLAIPFSIIVAWMAGQPLSLDFHITEAACMLFSVLIAGATMSDGKANYLKGLLLILTYFFFAAVFFVHKDD